MYDAVINKRPTQVKSPPGFPITGAEALVLVPGLNRCFLSVPLAFL